MNERKRWTSKRGRFDFSEDPGTVLDVRCTIRSPLPPPPKFSPLKPLTAMRTAYGLLLLRKTKLLRGGTCVYSESEYLRVNRITYAGRKGEARRNRFASVRNRTKLKQARTVPRGRDLYRVENRRSGCRNEALLHLTTDNNYCSQRGSPALLRYTVRFRVRANSLKIRSARVNHTVSSRFVLGARRRRSNSARRVERSRDCRLNRRRRRRRNKKYANIVFIILSCCGYTRNNHRH